MGDRGGAPLDSVDYEKLGSFYLGRVFDPEARRVTAEPLLYDSKDLTTHALCVGMTGSGKTGLCVSLLEEAAIDGVPAIAIDPKGDLANLLLIFEDLSPASILPRIDPAEAARHGETPDEWAASVAARGASRPSATSCASWTGWRARPGPRERASTGRSSTACSRGWGAASS